MLVETTVWLDGAPAKALPLPDRGLDFGDGLFETLLLREGVPLFLDQHRERMARGLLALYFPECQARIESDLQRACQAVAESGWRWSALRITVTRGGGPRGYAPPEPTVPRIVICATRLHGDLQTMAAPAQLSLATIRWGSQPALAGLKHLNRLEQVLAARESRVAGTDEAVMLDQAGQVISVTAGNLYLVYDKEVLTAPLDSCGIEGTRRALLIRHWAPAAGLKVRETALDLQQLESADEVFYSNSLLGFRPVARYEQSSWSSHEACAAVFGQYLEAQA